jgi:hypothetical protein
MNWQNLPEARDSDCNSMVLHADGFAAPRFAWSDEVVKNVSTLLPQAKR